MSEEHQPAIGDNSVTDAEHPPLPNRPNGQTVTLTEIDELAVAEAAKAGVTAPCQIAPDFTSWTADQFGNAMMILEGRIAVLEQRLHWLGEHLAPALGAHFRV